VLSASRRLHRLAFILRLWPELTRGRPWRKALVFLAAAASGQFVFRSIRRDIRDAFRSFAHDAAEITGRGKMHQLVDIIWLVAFQYCWPWSYYRYGFYLPELRRRAGDFIHHAEITALLTYLNQLLAPDDAQVLHCKDLFQDHCQKHNSTVRVVTARTPAGAIRVLVCSCRLSVGARPIDNFGAGGLAAPVDVATGRLGPAVSKASLTRIFRHPDTGEAIVGSLLPFWEEVLALATRTHASFPRIPFVGWDVAILNGGPLLVEGNPVWCVELVQMAHRKPLADTHFPDYFLHWLGVALLENSHRAHRREHLIQRLVMGGAKQEKSATPGWQGRLPAR
jgi:hypothetical protein